MTLTSLKARARRLGGQAVTAWFAARDPRTPLWVRALALFVAAYALSPIDLIPDFIPVVGYLDDLVLVPLGVALVLRFTPPEVLETARERARGAVSRPTSRWAAGVVISLWLLTAWLLAHWAGRWLHA